MKNQANNLTPYLFFGGKCREALNFYAKCFKGAAELITYGDAQGDACPKGAKDRIIHGSVKSDNFLMMGSDTPDYPTTPGDNMQLYYSCSSLEEIENLFKALSEKGNVKLALHDAFWGARFGMFTDQFGIHWMLAFEKAKTV